MKIILPCGRTLVADEEDVALIAGHKWKAIVCNKTHGGEYVYAYTSIKGRTTLMHRFLMQPMKGQVVDHINGNRLDNRRANLRICSHAENLRNRKRHYNTASGLKGVYAKGRKWRAYISTDGKKKWLGLFETKEQAHEAYRTAARSLHGQFANSG